MKRQLGSAASAVVLLALVVGAAAANVKILRANRDNPAVLTVQDAAQVSALNENPKPGTDVAASSADVPPSMNQPQAMDSAAPKGDANAPGLLPPPGPGGAKQALGSVGPGGDDADERDDHDGDGDHAGFVPLSPGQMALLRVAALAQVSPQEARDAARGIGAAAVVDRVKAAAAQVGIQLSQLAAVADLPPKHGRGHGGEDGDHENDD